jgi:hypothetical protein
MWLRLPLALVAALALPAAGAVAAPAVYWCDAQSCSVVVPPAGAAPVWVAPAMPQLAMPQPQQQTIVTAPYSPATPTRVEQRFPQRGDDLDPWCNNPATAFNVAMCGDADLRALAAERLRAFDQARSRLSREQQRVLAAGQNEWSEASPQKCGLSSDDAPELPLDPELKQCLMKAGRARLAYLRAYGTTGDAKSRSAATAPAADPDKPPTTDATAAPPAKRPITDANAPATATTPANQPTAAPGTAAAVGSPAKPPSPPQPAATPSAATPLQPSGSQLLSGAAPPWH